MVKFGVLNVIELFEIVPAGHARVSVACPHPHKEQSSIHSARACFVIKSRFFFIIGLSLIVYCYSRPLRRA